MKITTIGIDLAKNVFQVHGVDARDKAVVKKALKRMQVVPFFAKQSAENVEIADLLIRLTHNQRNWDSGCAFCICAT